MITNTRAITGLSFGSMFFLGVCLTMVGATARAGGLSAYEVGILFSVQNLMNVISILFFAAWSDSYPKRIILAVGGALTGFAIFFYFARPEFAFNLVVLALVGFGIGSFDAGTDPLLLDIHKSRQEFFLATNHFFVTMGQLSLTLFMVFLAVTWRSAVVFSSALLLLISLGFWFSRPPAPTHNPPSPKERFVLLTENSTLVVLFFLMVITMGMQLGATGVLTSFLGDQRGFSEQHSSIALVLYIVGVAVGRLTLGALVRVGTLTRTAMALYGASIVVTIGLFTIPVTAVIWPMVFALGFSLSALLPIIVTIAGLSYPRAPGAAIGVVKAAIPLGGVLIPFLFSLIARHAPGTNPGVIFPVIAIMGFVLTAARRKTLEPVVESA